MSEQEVRGLCLKSREIFLQQPILLELEAPLKICGEYFLGRGNGGKLPCESAISRCCRQRARPVVLERTIN